MMIMRRVVVVVVYFAMLVLVAVAQAHQYEESSSSSSTGQLAPISSVASLPAGDEGKSKPPAPGPACDGIYTCPAKCWVFRHDPKHYVACVELCKKHCKDGGGPALSDDIYTCTLACADSMPTKQLDSDHAVGGDYVETCFEKCKKNR